MIWLAEALSLIFQRFHYANKFCCVIYAAQIIELEQRLSKAHQEIEHLEVQATPPELQDVQQALFSATQELDESKLTVKKLETELTNAKVMVTREQQESGNLLVKLSQLQETIA